MTAPADYLTGDQVAALLGVSRRTIYRWADRGRIPPAWDWRRETIAPLVGIQPLPRGPQRRPDSLRYTLYRHRFERQR